MLRLAVSLDVNIFEIIKINASGELQLNTTNVDRSPGGVRIGAKSFLLALSGDVKILEVIKLHASFLIQVGGGPVTVGRGVTQATFNLGPSEWVVDLQARRTSSASRR